MDKSMESLLMIKPKLCTELIEKVLKAQYMLKKDFKTEEQLEIPVGTKEQLISYIVELANSEFLRNTIFTDEKGFYVYIASDENSIRMVSVNDDIMTHRNYHNSPEEMLYVLSWLNKFKLDQQNKKSK